MAEPMSTDCESVLKDNFVSPNNYSENSSVSYNSPSLSENETPPRSSSGEVNGTYESQFVNYLSDSSHNNGEITENVFPHSNLSLDTSDSELKGADATPSSSTSTLTPHIVDDQGVSLLTPTEKHCHESDSEGSIQFSKPSELASPSRSKDRSKSPRLSSVSPKSGSSPKVDRRSERKSSETVPNNKNSKKRLNNNTSRGRPSKQKGPVATYHSQISGDKNGIKLCIKKANVPQTTTNKKTRKRRKQRSRTSESDGSDYESSGKKNRLNLKSRTKLSLSEADASKSAGPSSLSSTIDADNDIEDDTVNRGEWSTRMPAEILVKIFQIVCNDVGCLPTLVRLSKVCRLWRSVALTPSLWHTIDLSVWHKERLRNDERLRWLIENRLIHCQELNLSNWKVSNISRIIEYLSTKCIDLRGLNISGWTCLNMDHLKYITTKCSKLQRLDLSGINAEKTITKCAVASQSLTQLADDMGERLTHLLLANNRLAGVPQIIAAIANHCPNLQLLDLSNIQTMSHTTASLHIEKLQKGCGKLRVLRITNTHIVLSTASVKEQVESPGFPMLEELSVATTNDCTQMDDTSIERILKSSHKLRLLDVRGCTRISDSSLVRVPAWDLEHLFLSGCYVTRFTGSGLELIAQKWSHSLLEMDLAWSTATEPLDAAVLALAEKEDESRLRILNLCGSSVSLDPVKAVLRKCRHLRSINLSSCRALPRGIKRLYEGPEVLELLASLEEKPKVPMETTTPVVDSSHTENSLVVDTPPTDVDSDVTSACRLPSFRSDVLVDDERQSLHNILDTKY